MGKFKVHSSNNFTIINNSVFYNRDISWKAKGILTQMLSLPETWDYTEAGLSTLSTDGLTSTRSALKELEKAGYLIRSFTRDEQGRIVDIDYDIFEIPIENKQNPFLENLKTDSNIVRSSVATDNPTMLSPVQTDSPTMGTPVITDSATMRPPVNGYSENGENKPFTGHPLLGFPITGFPKSENKHNKELNIINNQSNKESTTEPDTDDRKVGLPENGSPQDSKSKLPAESILEERINSGASCRLDSSEISNHKKDISLKSDIQINSLCETAGSFEHEDETTDLLSELDTDSYGKSDSDECGVSVHELSGKRDFNLTANGNGKLNQSLSVFVDKKKVSTNETDHGSELCQSDYEENKTTIELKSSNGLRFDSNPSIKSSDTASSLYAYKDRDVAGLKSENPDIQSDKVGINSVTLYDRAKNDSTMNGKGNQDMKSCSDDCDVVQTQDILTNEDSDLSVHDYEMGNESKFVMIDKEKKESVAVHELPVHDDNSFGKQYDSTTSGQNGINHTQTGQNNYISPMDHKIDCEDQMITDERYARREKEHQTGMWNTYEIDGYFFAEPLSSRNTADKGQYSRPKQRMRVEAEPVSYQNMVMPAKKETKVYSSFEELCHDVQDILNHPYMTDVLQVIQTILCSQEPYVQVKNTNIPKNEFDTMLLSIPKSEILDIAHAVFENRYGIRNQFSYIKTLLYIAATKRFGSKTYAKQENGPVRGGYANIYRNGYGTKFGNFEQRNYDYEALERQLLQRNYEL